MKDIVPTNPQYYIERDLVAPPKYYQAKGLVTKKMYQIELEVARSNVAIISRAYPNAIVIMDEQDIVRVEANAEDAPKIDFDLRECLPPIVSHTIVVRE